MRKTYIKIADAFLSISRDCFNQYGVANVEYYRNLAAHELSESVKYFLLSECFKHDVWVGSTTSIKTLCSLLREHNKKFPMIEKYAEVLDICESSDIVATAIAINNEDFLDLFAQMDEYLPAHALDGC